MSKPIIVREIRLGPLHKPTGNTCHRSGLDLIPPTIMLKIAKFSDTVGFYLLHYDNDGNEITDTFHETVEDAIAQAEWEYGIKENEWDQVH